MTPVPPSSLSDAALLAETARAACAERRATADLVALLAEVDARRLYLGQGYASLFAWCIDVLHLSEPAAYSRIAAARVARRYPMIVTLLRDGDLTLTTVTLLAAHLTDENHEALLEAARHASKRDVERMVASLVPQPAIASTLRRLPSPPASPVLLDVPFPPPPVADHDGGFAPDAPVRQEPGASKDCSERQPASAAPQNGAHAGGTGSVAPPRGVVAPLGPDRYLLKITLSASAHARLERARDLLRHVVPSGDPAAIVDRALSVLVDELEKSRCAAAHRPPARPRATSTPRHVPAAVRRAVWTRDEGRCAFVGATGRCRETGWLELHHRVPCARGGPASVENIELRCRAHNAYEAEREFGARVPARRGRSARVTTTLAGQSPPGDVAARSSGQSRSRRDP